MFVELNNLYPILDYRITEQIYSGRKTLVYRGIREQDQKPVILKLMRNEYPSFAEIAQFRNQYTIIQNLDIPGVVKPHSLENYRSSYILFMEDFGGISLKDWQGSKSKKGKEAITLTEFFHIAIEVSSTLEELHRHRIIHKDIKPANILIQPTTNEIKIIDFSLATLLPKEIQVITNPNVLEGTLAYISPEQTGRMNRGIDYRTDFYSLGVTFFELLTGQLPFNSTDPMELVYSHIAKEPPKASGINPSIPPILSAIISKLMAKNAEDRYQTGYGLKHDLEICRNQWQEKENISTFELGNRDISNCFVIPEKLYGRQREVETLLASFNRVTQGKTEIILVTGLSGIGKTAVVNEVHKPIVKQRSYFIKGKFDQFQHDTPLSGLVQAFRDLIDQLISETDTQIQQWKEKILSVLGTHGQVITDVIPELERIIGKQPPVAEISGSAVQNRFNLLFQRFIQIFTTKEHPLVIFLDDLQWADTASLNFIQLLMGQGAASINDEMQNEDPGNFFVIGAYRANEVSNAHPLNLTLQEIAKTGTSINSINLSPLNQSDLNRLVADTLHCQEVVALPLTQMVFAKTKGNPFFVTQFLNSLHEDGLITLNFELSHWQYDIAKIQALSLTEDVVQFMATQIEKLPTNTNNLLQLAACIGSEFELKTLAIIHEKSLVDTAEDLWPALLDGLILPRNEVYNFLPENEEEQQIVVKGEELHKSTSSNSHKILKYRFVHDRVQQAAYSLIPIDQKKIIHLKLGLLLFKNTPLEQREESIFILVHQLNIAGELITDQTQRHKLSEMNLTAGRKALACTAYSSAIKYLTTGIKLLAGDSWDIKYKLTLALYETAAEAAYLNGEFEQTEQLIQIVLAKANTLLEKVKVYEITIQTYGAQGKAIEAVKAALAFLKLLGVEFPEHPNQTDIQKEMEIIASSLANRNIEELIDLPEMRQAEPLVIMRILTSVIALAYQSVPELMPLICLKQINLSLKYGNSPLSAFAYVTYGLMLCGPWEDIELGYQFGKLATNLLSKSNIKGIKAKIIQTFNALVRHWKEPVRETLQPLLEAYAAGLETGDLEFAAYSLCSYCYISYFSGKELTRLEQEMANYSYATCQIKQDRAFYWIKIYQQTVFNLMGAVENPCHLIGEAYNETKNLPVHTQANDESGLVYVYLCKLHLCYLFANYSEAVENAVIAEQYLRAVTGQFVIPQFYFYSSLALLAVYDDAESSKQEEILAKVLANQENIRKWADHAPINHLHKFYLVEAEKYQVLAQYLEAMENYDHAIFLAKENEYIHEEALAYELASKFYLKWGKQKIAQTYLIDAYYGYVRWGALAKVNDLKKRYPQLLNSILQQEKLSLHSSESNTFEVSLAPSESINKTILSTSETVTTSNTSMSDRLDLAAVIKASQALSGEIELKELISTLMEVVMENAGAYKCVLILSARDELNLTVAAIRTSSNFNVSQTEFVSIPLESSSDVPISLINYVKRTREILVVDDVKTQASIVVDIYIIHEEPKSLLCIPMINQSKLLGILYLENNLTIGAFTRDRLELLKLLTSQAAISLENALLYKNLAQVNARLEEYNHTLEEKVTARTVEINEKNQSLLQALEELKRTQSQLIQSEKMSSLGQMVAGIAHEINNPINFIHGNIAHTSEYLQDLLDLIAVYQQEYPDPTVLVVEKSQEIDLEFLEKDLPKTINSMKVGSSRIRNIVLGLRNFSRLDESEMKPVDIHEGLDNTLMILQHRFKKNSPSAKRFANKNSCEIEVIKEYGNIPVITCYPSQLNQVFMNILSNAIDALNDMQVDEQTISSPTIRICTELTNSNLLKIRFVDNGLGMTTSVQQKIFDPFFTTKPVGSGTGLGLSISYQIIVDKHQGKLTCNSQVGQGTEFVIEIPIR